MKIEKLRENNKKKWIIGIIVFILLVSTIALVTSRAKYKVTQKIQLVNGTINYSKSDVNIVALYVDNAQTNSIPTSGTYGIDQTSSFCTTDGSSDKAKKDTSITISMSNKKIVVSNVTKKNTKCFVYLKTLNGKTVSEVIASLGAKEQTSTVPNFANVATTNEGVYYTQDNDGITYYYRGAVTNNYLKFANKWWRIIRFNGDGSIRIIYDGTSYHANGTSTIDSIAISNVQFNTSSDKAEYVGYMYTPNDIHGHTFSSNIMDKLDSWYTSNLKSYEDYIDKNAGFCGDRSGAITSGEFVFLGAYNRLYSNKMPTFVCSEPGYDLYTTRSSTKGNRALANPIGLITVDEVAFGGGADSKNNSSYYIYNGQRYWTMTPCMIDYGGGPDVYNVYSNGSLSIPIDGATTLKFGVRPVINLKPNVILSGNGTQNTPYEVVGLS